MPAKREVMVLSGTQLRQLFALGDVVAAVESVYLATGAQQARIYAAPASCCLPAACSASKPGYPAGTGLAPWVTAVPLALAAGETATGSAARSAYLWAFTAIFLGVLWRAHPILERRGEKAAEAARLAAEQMNGFLPG